MNYETFKNQFRQSYENSGLREVYKEKVNLVKTKIIAEFRKSGYERFVDFQMEKLNSVDTNITSENHEAIGFYITALTEINPKTDL
ncbi:MAG: hypothetical protein LBE36_06480 [Flavobacteriaceae bacterium]|jgi:hypothetical protein|nr:hypothetical protein [Flavobacteriaceae bacterium]